MCQASYQTLALPLLLFFFKKTWPRHLFFGSAVSCFNASGIYFFGFGLHRLARHGKRQWIIVVMWSSQLTEGEVGLPVGTAEKQVRTTPCTSPVVSHFAPNPQLFYFHLLFVFLQLQNCSEATWILALYGFVAKFLAQEDSWIAHKYVKSQIWWWRVPNEAFALNLNCRRSRRWRIGQSTQVTSTGWGRTGPFWKTSAAQSLFYSLWRMLKFGILVNADLDTSANFWPFIDNRTYLYTYDK